MSKGLREQQSLILEELSELTDYLEGLPEPLRASGGFRSYEERLRRLEAELAMARLLSLLDEKPASIKAIEDVEHHEIARYLYDSNVLSQLSMEFLEERERAVAAATRVSLWVLFASAVGVGLLVLAAVTSVWPIWWTVRALAVGGLAAAFLLRLSGSLRRRWWQRAEALDAVLHEIQYMASQSDRHDLTQDDINQSLERLLWFSGEPRPSRLRTAPWQTAGPSAGADQ